MHAKELKCQHHYLLLDAYSRDMLICAFLPPRTRYFIWKNIVFSAFF